MAKFNWQKIQQENKAQRERQRALNSAPKKKVDPKILKKIEDRQLDNRKKKAKEDKQTLKQKQKDFKAEKKKLDFEWLQFVKKYRPNQSYSRNQWMRDREKIAQLEKQNN